MLYSRSLLVIYFIYSSVPWMEEPGRLQSMGSLRVRHNWATSLSCIGEGNGNPLQCSCLENSRDEGAWWAALYGVAQSWTWLKWLSSSRKPDNKSLIMLWYRWALSNADCLRIYVLNVSRIFKGKEMYFWGPTPLKQSNTFPITEWRLWRVEADHRADEEKLIWEWIIIEM